MHISILSLLPENAIDSEQKFNGIDICKGRFDIDVTRRLITYWKFLNSCFKDQKL